MKRLSDLARTRGVELRVVEGAHHTKVWVGDRFTAVPRHWEINERLAQAILKEVDA